MELQDFKPNPTQRQILKGIEKAQQQGRQPRFVVWKGRPVSTFSPATLLSLREYRRIHGIL